jgi:hypothetical protein
MKGLLAHLIVEEYIKKNPQMVKIASDIKKNLLKFVIYHQQQYPDTSEWNKDDWARYYHESGSFLDVEKEVLLLFPKMIEEIMKPGPNTKTLYPYQFDLDELIWFPLVFNLEATGIASYNILS